MLERVLFSGYTKNSGKGVYAAEFNSDNGELSTPRALVELDGPTYIDVTNDMKLIALAKKGDRGGIVVYDIGSDTPKMLDEDFSEETSPSYVKYDASRNLIFSAYFHLSKVKIDHLTDDGKIEHYSEVKFEGHGPRVEQDQSKPHFSALTPDGKLIICDYGADRIYIYNIDDPKEPKLTWRLTDMLRQEKRYNDFHSLEEFDFQRVPEVLILAGLDFVNLNELSEIEKAILQEHFIDGQSLVILAKRYNHTSRGLRYCRNRLLKKLRYMSVR